MSEIHHISSSLLELSVIKDIVDNQKKIALSKEATDKINNSYEFLSKKIKNNQTPIYGINTGFGSLCNVKISSENLSKLQENSGYFSCLWYGRVCAQGYSEVNVIA